MRIKVPILTLMQTTKKKVTSPISNLERFRSSSADNNQNKINNNINKNNNKNNNNNNNNSTAVNLFGTYLNSNPKEKSQPPPIPKPKPKPEPEPEQKTEPKAQLNTETIAKPKTLSSRTKSDDESYGLSVDEMMNPVMSSQSERTLIPLKRKAPPPPAGRLSGKIEFISGEMGSGRGNDQIGTLVLLPSRIGHGWIYAKSGMYQVKLEETSHWGPDDDKNEKANSKGKGKDTKNKRVKEGGACLFDSDDGKFGRNIRGINRLSEQALLACLNEERTATLYNALYYITQTKFDDHNSLQNEFVNFDKYEVADLVDRSEHAVNAFVNSEGGTIFIGIDKEKDIKGVKLSKVELDNFRERLEGRVTQFQPQSQNLVSKLNIGFVPVVQADGTFIDNLVVIKISIEGPHLNSKGEPIVFRTAQGELWMKKIGYIVKSV